MKISTRNFIWTNNGIAITIDRWLTKCRLNFVLQ